MSGSLFTNKFKPLYGDFKTEFKKRLIECSSLTIATGYFGISALEENEKAFIDLAKRGNFRLLVGMILRGGCTKKQEEKLRSFDGLIRSINKNSGVSVSLEEYHGKIYYFNNNNSNFLYIGSSNFSEQGFASRYECTALVEEPNIHKATKEYLDHLFLYDEKEKDESISIPISEAEFARYNYNISRLGKVREIKKQLSTYEINKSEFPDLSKQLGFVDIQLRVDEWKASSLNLFFDKGRYNKKTKKYSLRPWYEVEITTQTSEQKNPFYPQSGSFILYASDNNKYYKIMCTVSSGPLKLKAIQSSKKSGGRETLGKLIKGKLERLGFLKEGEKITSDVLYEYGRKSIRLIKMENQVYVLDF